MLPNDITQMIDDIKRIQAICQSLDDGESPFLLLDHDFAWKYFPGEMRKAVIDVVLRDLGEENPD